MNSIFQYCPLQYHYNSASGEVLNVALLVLFPDQQKLAFVYPEKLTRLRAAYPNSIAERTIKAFFKGIASKVDALNRQPEIFNDYRNRTLDFINDEILVRDASALQFGEIKTSILYTEDLTKIIKQLEVLYLSAYEVEEVSYKKHTEEYLIKEYRNKIRLGDDQIFTRRKIEENKQIGEYTFPFAWQNGTYNIVSPVSLDLKLPESIIKKATLNFGKFTLLQGYADENKARFDILLAEPKLKGLASKYDEAVKILEQVPCVKLWGESQLDEYSQKTLDTLIFTK
ncbi:MAG: hypothetical protein ACOVOW_07295 [Spirosomataceae bacterium]